ncbi:FtsW/RodA/SpoVE family cell cycle protein [Synechococcales cyanobacterium C]|uniref:Probable peptidoglycan glycosyltransferase FtsW n=1 Tax=Petrachloros mirabilis ULC683 TaxID=2781853 RepID=A0A8K2ACJ7_9CYAN|nr:FtsW/RodA/SpoVE family cell cycle protein [Petrachloros mirabilis ULC683]
MNLRRFIPFLDPSVQDWSFEARLLYRLTFAWLFVGLVVLFSASYHVGVVENVGGLFYFSRQLLWVGVGLVAFCGVLHTSLQKQFKLAPFGFFLFLLLIFATRIPGLGESAYGATRWIKIGPIPLQPSELMKPFLILQGALVFGYWSRLSLRDRLQWLGLFSLTLLGILIQPNLSTTSLSGMSLWLMALAAGLPLSSLGLTAFGGVGLAAISVSLNEYQLKRVTSFLDPWSDPLGDAFQLVQSLIAIGSGGVGGAGFGLSQQKLSYLPIQHTDFIFSIYAEEYGLVGSLFLIGILMTYSFLGLRVSLKTVDPIRRLVAIGATVFLVGQSLLNIGVATGVLPTTGLPLPMFSYGGSSMIASLMISALLIRVARESQGADVIPLYAEATPPPLRPPISQPRSLQIFSSPPASSAKSASSRRLPSTQTSRSGGRTKPDLPPRLPVQTSTLGSRSQRRLGSQPRPRAAVPPKTSSVWRWPLGNSSNPRR